MADRKSSSSDLWTGVACLGIIAAIALPFARFDPSKAESFSRDRYPLMVSALGEPQHMTACVDRDPRPDSVLRFPDGRIFYMPDGSISACYILVRKGTEEDRRIDAARQKYAK